MNNIYYRVRLPDGTMSGLSSLSSAQAIAAAHNGTVEVDEAEFFNIHGCECSEES